MVAVVSSNPTGGNFFFLLFKTLNVNFVQKCQICVENEKPDCWTQNDHRRIVKQSHTSIYSQNSPEGLNCVDQIRTDLQISESLLHNQTPDINEISSFRNITLECSFKSYL